MTRFTIHAELSPITGYGQHLLQILHWFERRGIFVSLRPLAVREQFGAKIPLWAKTRVVQMIQPEPWELLLSPPTVRPTPGKKTVYFTMWESTRLPDPNVELVNMAEIVIVPSQWCRETFERSGVKKPIFVVPLGIDPEIFKYSPPPAGPVTTFACAGRTAHGRERKGLDAAIRSFLAAFPYESNVRMKVKCHDDCELPKIDDSRILVTRGHLTASGLAEWLLGANAFVSCACGEGWGLWQHQASAMGRPVVGTIYGGLREFLGVDNSYACLYREMDSSEHFGGTWAVPDLDSVIASMREIHELPGKAEVRGLMAAEVARAFTWERSCDELIEVVSCVGALEKYTGRSFLYPRLRQGHYARGPVESVENQARAKGWDVTVDVGSLTREHYSMNPSVAGDAWFYRNSLGLNRKKSQISVHTPHTTKILDLPGGKEEWCEDPRAMLLADGYLLSYTRSGSGFPTQEVAFLDGALEVIRHWHVDYGKNGRIASAATGPEKNWIWFFHDNAWHMIYWLEPMEVVRVHKSKPIEVYKSNKHYPGWKWGVKHGGAHPVRIGDEYFGFCHTLLPWYGRDRSRYFVAAYAFEAKPPFALTRHSREPLLFSEDVWDENPCSCVIVGGAVFQEDEQQWILAVGAADKQCLRIEVPHRDILENLINI